MTDLSVSTTNLCLIVVIPLSNGKTLQYVLFVTSFQQFLSPSNVCRDCKKKFFFAVCHYNGEKQTNNPLSKLTALLDTY